MCQRCGIRPREDFMHCQYQLFSREIENSLHLICSSFEYEHEYYDSTFLVNKTVNISVQVDVNKFVLLVILFELLSFTKRQTDLKTLYVFPVYAEKKSNILSPSDQLHGRLNP